MNKGETYYCPNLLSFDGTKYNSYRWDGDKWDLKLKSRNLVCKTVKQAEEMYDLFIDLVGGKE